MVVAWHDAAFALPEPILTPVVMQKVLNKFHLQHKLKKTFTQDDLSMISKLLFVEDGDDKVLTEEERRKKAIEESE